LEFVDLLLHEFKLLLVESDLSGIFELLSDLQVGDLLVSRSLFLDFVIQFLLLAV
jgi:hypothetical protein